MDVDGASPAPLNPGPSPAQRPRRRGPPPLVEESSAAERLFLAGQARAHQQQQQDDWGTPGGGAKGAAAKRKQQQQQQQRTPGGGQQGEGAQGQGQGGEEGAALPPVSAYLLGPCEMEEPPEKLPLDEAVARCIDAAAGGRVELRQRLLAGILLTGDAGGTRGLAGLVERRVAAIVAAQPLQGVGLAAVQPPMVNVLEQRGDPRHTAWRGAALLACLDSTSSGRDGWLTRRQWAPELAAGAGGAPPGRAAAAVNRHARLFSFLRAQQGA
ncbi:hypothetical protein MNEG_11882 [Monoraphidium neglectum]|uniref:Uncharacterized protein n=1 Tax=Monoraphidium neglectum TaxID=145388 RepID=A0A0D2KJR0_9CHLO|nr:hypothetical protein MNEG_11882 [Monoraphidium neglectum]KIY96083.1 hypothetical protein MNEG_11882 [Monoraphidium neglectum]|eukprot:XP_013895103.1 hypothetical protein MNEG_11882 [Monoraphidium neglectum]